ncbi:MAG TPA: hypothetical protein VKA40_04055 [Nitrososphaera sp.]|nr:hypothetical protein [Nitrososphaera sp.]
MIFTRSIINKSKTIIRRKYDPSHFYRRREVTIVDRDPGNGVCNIQNKQVANLISITIK